jgi:hypothetical protein
VLIIGWKAPDAIYSGSLEKDEVFVFGKDINLLVDDPGTGRPLLFASKLVSACEDANEDVGAVDSRRCFRRHRLSDVRWQAPSGEPGAVLLAKIDQEYIGLYRCPMHSHRPAESDLHLTRRGPSPRSTFDLQVLLSSTAIWCDASMLGCSRSRPLDPAAEP